MVFLSYYLVLSAILFACGVTGFLIKRNIITIFMSIELMLNGVNLSFVAFAAKWHALSGHVFVFFVMVVAAAEAAVGLAIIIAVYRTRETLNIDQVNLLMFFMLTLVLASNSLLMFIGWEGVGLASYLLIGFWFTKDSAAAAGKKAFIVNRIGDFGFLIALFLIIQHFNTLDFQHVFAAVQPFGPETGGAGFLTAIALLLMVGACGKSAQIPLYVWLPDAMEGPTPVSALIHAATMVTAG